ncbi:AraC family transcriptional regulator [Xanthomonas sp. NCPPB 2654]|uniref:AraC family transcriptional regulator n=1 Tax=unclassified Xanthomonas TaxID=2643310 RepID=UPI0021E0E3BC|nr:MULTISPECIES: AraC family transcriptional regulator [unclassified Xanthomonas]MDL5365407.1 AraC family transcriptional regulator [Xanthomonas sp. NCPPB 2654]UYC20145.1 AraC family transcriptional regulator [Xanthomonas sp. CFBP 8443]
MVDPLAEVVTLLQPTARFSKHVVGAGPWRIRRSDAGQPFYCAVLEGGCRLALDGGEPIVLQAGDFVLVPAAYVVTMSSLVPHEGAVETMPTALGPGLFRIGAQEGPTDLRILAGHCSFGSPDAALLVSLLPQLVCVRGEQRLATLVHLVSEESREARPAREVVLARLLEVLLIEALRSAAGTGASPGLARGLADARLAAAIRAMHEQPTRAWTVVALAKEAALSRSAFFERFGRTVGMAPMEYLLAWRMALAKDLLRRTEFGIADIAERVGYSSASTFSVAFARHVGQPPTQYARASGRGSTRSQAAVSDRVEDRE